MAMSLGTAEAQRRMADDLLEAGRMAEARSASMPPRPAQPAPVHGSGMQESPDLGATPPEAASLAPAGGSFAPAQSRSSSLPPSTHPQPQGNAKEAGGMCTPPAVNPPPMRSSYTPDVVHSMPTTPNVGEAPPRAQSPAGKHFDGSDAGAPGAPMAGASTEPPPNRSVAVRQGSLPVSVQTAVSIFPALFTLFCLGTFLIPIWILWHIRQDVNAQQWIGTSFWPVLLLLLLLMYALAHVAHTMKQGPIKPIVIGASVGSCLVLLLLASHALVQAYRYGRALAASNCDAHPAKEEMEISWQSAASFYANCAAARTDSEGLTFAQAVAIYRIQDCPGYEDASKLHGSKWSYLQSLEDDYQCAGWCAEGQSLWTRLYTRDACGAAVADVLANKVQQSAMQVVTYLIVALGGVSVSLVTLGPIFKQNGIAW